MKSPDLFECDICHFLNIREENQIDKSKLPFKYGYEDPIHKINLIAVRCSECAGLPYRLEEGQPYRIDIVACTGPTIPSSNHKYNYWPRGIGHVLEVFLSDLPMNFPRTEPLELGFIIVEDVNLIAVGYKLPLSHNWCVTPYSWHELKPEHRAKPPHDEETLSNTSFTLAIVDKKSFRYALIRHYSLPDDFSREFHDAIYKHINRDAPDQDIYRLRVDNLDCLLLNKCFDDANIVRCIMVENL